mgnify:CR=1 FL=1
MNYSQTKIYRYIKRSQFFYFAKIRLLNKDYKLYKTDMETSQYKSKDIIKKEMDLVKKYWHCQPLHYIRYQLYSKSLSKEELLDYIPPYYHYNFHTAHMYDNIDQDRYNNKLELYKLFVERNVHTPKVIGYFKGNDFYNINDEKQNVADLFSLLANEEKLFIKPAFGAGGTGIIVLKKRNEQFFYQTSAIRPSDLHNILNNRKTYVVQKGILQRDDFKEINPTSVNTLRAVTQWTDNGPQLKVCVMRIGRSGRDVDNSHQGGLSVQVNVNDGSLFPTATAEHGGGILEKHPDTGFIFKDFTIENWADIKQSIINYAQRFPELKEIGWDVAVTNRGIEIIELNLGYGLSHLQCCCGGLRRILNIFPEK